MLENCFSVYVNVILFLQNRHLLKCFDLCKQKIKRILGPFGTKRFEFFLKIEAKKKKKWLGLSLLFKLNEFHFL